MAVGRAILRRTENACKDEDIVLIRMYGSERRMIINSNYNNSEPGR
jgi:hypothetical protein